MGIPGSPGLPGDQGAPGAIGSRGKELKLGPNWSILKWIHEILVS